MILLKETVYRSIIFDINRKPLLVDTYGGDDVHVVHNEFMGHDFDSLQHVNSLTKQQMIFFDRLILDQKISKVRLSGIVCANIGVTLYREIERRIILGGNGKVLGLRLSSYVAPSKPILPVDFSNVALETYANQIGLSIAQLKVLFYRVYFSRISAADIAKLIDMQINSVYRYSALIKEILDIPSFIGQAALDWLEEIKFFEVLAKHLTNCFVSADDLIEIKSQAKQTGQEELLANCHFHVLD
ncbi:MULTISPECIES: hypothetical protein [Cysteiniphilum]|uniref:hypothetical protein n=1 Tax=Cysteiniphilum TaxID=2056696 RepID=UPI00177CA009|nr:MULTISPECIES: hypothetical protein [Cysteiniphilum]